jgi:hypothetical protein
VLHIVPFRILLFIKTLHDTKEEKIGSGIEKCRTVINSTRVQFTKCAMAYIPQKHSAWHIFAMLVYLRRPFILCLSSLFFCGRWNLCLYKQRRFLFDENNRLKIVRIRQKIVLMHDKFMLAVW